MVPAAGPAPTRTGGERRAREDRHERVPEGELAPAWADMGGELQDDAPAMKAPRVAAGLAAGPGTPAGPRHGAGGAAAGRDGADARGNAACAHPGAAAAGSLGPDAGAAGPAQARAGGRTQPAAERSGRAALDAWRLLYAAVSMPVKRAAEGRQVQVAQLMRGVHHVGRFENRIRLLVDRERAAAVREALRGDGWAAQVGELSHDMLPDLRAHAPAPPAEHGTHGDTTQRGHGDGAGGVGPHAEYGQGGGAGGAGSHAARVVVSAE